jgi:hypothetical protein
MGDVPPSSKSPNDHLAPEVPHSYLPGSASGENYTGFAQELVSDPPALRPQYDHQFDPSQNAFSAQFDMTHQQDTGRGALGGPYNMSAMANALPQPTFRPGMNSAGPARYNTEMSSPNGPPVAQYPGPSNMGHLAGQQFYMAQHAHMSPYYNAQLPAAQQQTGLSPRHNMGFYPSQAMMSHTQQPLPSGYYYPHPSQYANHNSAVSGNMMPSQYMPHVPRGNSPAGYQGTYGAGGGTYRGPEGGYRTQPSGCHFQNKSADET